jgi:hypothetical protein
MPLEMFRGIFFRRKFGPLAIALIDLVCYQKQYKFFCLQRSTVKHLMSIKIRLNFYWIVVGASQRPALINYSEKY